MFLNARMFLVFAAMCGCLVASKQSSTCRACEKMRHRRATTEAPPPESDCKPATPSSPPPLKPVPRGYIKYHGYGYYKLYERAATWSVAQETCERDGGNLAVINSDGEADRVITAISHELRVQGSASGCCVFLGGQRIGDQFYTVFGGELRDAGFDKWAANEPTGGGQYCLAWNPREPNYRDMFCYYPEAFVCEHLNANYTKPRRG